MILPKAKTKSTNYFILLLGVLFILWGSYNYYQPRILSFDYSPKEIQQVPPDVSLERIKIESLAIDLPLESSLIANGIWEVSEDGISHLASSKSPTQGGNIVIYGHNKKHLFGSLVNIKEGDLVELTTPSGSYSYSVTQTKTVTPREIEMVLPTDSEVLTMYTCTGILDSMRFIVRAVPSPEPQN